ncbi:MAG: PhoPQ-activated pathogenicity, partial [bacterium]|nr:PhoPQ-activated pathogenicity [bacterium]
PAAWPAEQTALDRYVSDADPSYRYEVVDSFPNLGYTTHMIEMTSQTWLTTDEVNRTEWKHWITVVVPSKVSSTTALLFIGGGRNGGSAPLAADKRLVDFARATKAVVAELAMVPNQPLRFGKERRGRTEDSLIAYCWDKYLRTGDEKWLPRLPMTKAVVRAMDAVTNFASSEAGGGHTVDRYVVTGGSKRGWTAWTTAAVDKRVVAIIPMVIDMLNLQPSMIHHYRAYGFWAPAIADYERMGVMKWVGTPEFGKLAAEVDPYFYRDRLT